MSAYPPVPQYPVPAYRPMTVGDWIVTKLVLLIPMVGLIMLFVWAFSQDTHPSKRTFCQAALILAACIFVLVLLSFLVFGGLAAVIGAAAQKNLPNPSP